MSQPTMPMPLADMPGGPLDLDDFRIHDRHEVAAVLRELVKARAVLTLTAPSGPAFPSCLFDVNTQQGVIRFDARTRDAGLAALLHAPRLVAVGYLDSVKVQFDLQGLVLVHDVDGTALNARLPGEVFRFQRRASVRVRPLLNSPPYVQLAYPPPAGTVTRLRVLDVSLGGVSCLIPRDVSAPAVGQQVNDTEVVLDEETRFTCALLVRHVTPALEGGQGARVGLEFVGLDGMSLRVLQRYIFNTQRARRALDKGIDNA